MSRHQVTRRHHGEVQSPISSPAACRCRGRALDPEGDQGVLYGREDETRAGARTYQQGDEESKQNKTEDQHPRDRQPSLPIQRGRLIKTQAATTTQDTDSEKARANIPRPSTEKSPTAIPPETQTPTVTTAPSKPPTSPKTTEPHPVPGRRGHGRPLRNGLHHQHIVGLNGEARAASKH